MAFQKTYVLLTAAFSLGACIQVDDDYYDLSGEGVVSNKHKDQAHHAIHAHQSAMEGDEQRLHAERLMVVNTEIAYDVQNKDADLDAGLEEPPKCTARKDKLVEKIMNEAKLELTEDDRDMVTQLVHAGTLPASPTDKAKFAPLFGPPSEKKTANPMWWSGFNVAADNDDLRNSRATLLHVAKILNGYIDLELLSYELSEMLNKYCKEPEHKKYFGAHSTEFSRLGLDRIKDDAGHVPYYVVGVDNLNPKDRTTQLVGLKSKKQENIAPTEGPIEDKWFYKKELTELVAAGVHDRLKIKIMVPSESECLPILASLQEHEDVKKSGVQVNPKACDP